MKKQVIALSLGLFTIGIFAQKNELKTAEKALKKNDYATALSAVSSIDSMEDSMDDKYKAKYYFLKAQALSGSDKTEEAAETFNKLFAFEKQIGKDKYTEDAKPMLNALVKKVSENAIALYNKDKDYKNAAQGFYLTYKLSPTDTSFLYNAAVSASLAKDYDASLKFYRKLQDLGYTGISTQYFAVNKESGEKENLGSKENRDALVKFGQYINPTSEVSESKQADIIKNISYTLINQGKTEEAIVAIKEARKASPKDLNLLLNEAQLYIQLKQTAKFAALMEEAIELDPNNPTLFFNLGVVNQNENKTEQAIEFYKKAIELKPDYGDAYMNLAVAILSGEQQIVNEMNKNLSNFKKYDELEKKQKDLYRRALPYLEKADEIKRTQETVKSLTNMYDILLMTEKADALRAVLKKMTAE